MNLYTENEFRNQKVTITVTLNLPTELISQIQTNYDHSIFLFSDLGEREKKYRNLITY